MFKVSDSAYISLLSQKSFKSRSCLYFTWHRCNWPLSSTYSWSNPCTFRSTARNPKQQFRLANRFGCGRTAVSRSVRLSTKAVHSQSFGISCKGGIACRTREGTNSRRPDIFTKERISSASGNIAEKPVFGFSASMTNKEQRWCLKSNNHHHPYIGSMAAW